MNWLAHIFLSEQNIDFQMGNYLHDPLKGKSWEGASKDLIKGMNTHVIIDSFTDSNLIVKDSKKRLREKGLLKSIVIDISYDYFLTKNWNDFSHIPLDEFSQRFYVDASKKIDCMPKNAGEFVNRLIHFDMLNKYQNIKHLEEAFERFDKRLSTKLLSRDTTSSYIGTLEKNIDHLEKDFLLFFPILCNEVKKNVDKNKIKHWKI